MSRCVYCLLTVVPVWFCVQWSVVCSESKDRMNFQFADQSTQEERKVNVGSPAIVLQDLLASDVRLLDFVILGHTDEDDGLEKHLLADAVQIVSTIRGEFVIEEGSMKCYEGTSVSGGKAFCIVMKDPTWDILKDCLEVFLSKTESTVDNKSLTRSVFYCGHGLLDGSVLLVDKAVSYTDFKNAVFPTDGSNGEWSDMNHKLNLYLNCCFALRIATLMFPDQPLGRLFLTALQDHLNDKEYEDRGMNLQEVVNVMNVKLCELLPSIVDQNSLKCVPLGFGRMYGTGNVEILLRGLLYRQLTPLLLRDPECISLRYKKWTPLDLNKALQPCSHDKLAETESPLFYAFRANRGDSFLLRVGQWSLLVDGGLETNPCYWPIVKDLATYDMLLTHSDHDHLHGLAFAVDADVLREEDAILDDPILQNAPELKNFYIATKDTVLEPLRTLNYATDLASRVINKCRYPIDRQVIVDNVGENFTVDLIRILPTEIITGGRKKSIAKTLRHYFKNPTGSFANQTGLVIIAQITSKTVPSMIWTVLFTGDAYGHDIAYGLRLRNNLGNDLPVEDDLIVVTVMTVPHHGSDKNRFAKLLKVCRAKIYIVSTNGKSYGHPHTNVCNLLRKQIKTYGARVHFSYEERAVRFKSVLDDYLHGNVTYGSGPLDLSGY